MSVIWQKVSLSRGRANIIRLLIVTFVLSVAANGQSGVAVSGKATVQSGVGIQNAVVVLYSRDQVLLTNTDKSGKFEFDNVPAGIYSLEVSIFPFKTKIVEGIQVKNKAVGLLSINLEIGDLNADCTKQYQTSYEKQVAGSPALTGIVRISYPRDAGLPQTKLSLSKAGETDLLAVQTSNDAGEFRFYDFKPGRYVLNASRKGYKDIEGIKFWIARENQTKLTIGMIEPGMMFVCE